MKKSVQNKSDARRSVALCLFRVSGFIDSKPIILRSNETKNNVVHKESNLHFSANKIRIITII